MMISLVVLYFLTNYLINKETEEDLHTITYQLERLIENNLTVNSIEPLIGITETTESQTNKIKDTLIFDPSQNEVELFRELTTYKNINSKNYKITARTLVVESQDILIAIFLSYIGILLFSFLIQFFVNKKSSEQIWKPFVNNLETLKKFSLHSNQKLHFEKTDVLEFTELAEELESLTNKVKSDYENLKQFTEDVSHELQTPLAIIQAKIGNLIDEDSINEKQFQLLSDVQQNILRITLLNKKLALLTKIENKQFKSLKQINITKKLKKSIVTFQEQTLHNIEVGELTDIEIYLDIMLSKIIIDNLLTNAIKYTLEGGTIKVSTTTNAIVIANSGQEAIKHPEKLYDRFYRESTTKKSLGLGLAIVKKICDAHNFKINYSFIEGFHIFKIQFKN